MTYLLALLLLLAFAAGWVACVVFGAATEGDRRCGTVDLSVAAARGELHLAAVEDGDGPA